jgi:hypothetical protein
MLTDLTDCGHLCAELPATWHLLHATHITHLLAGCLVLQTALTVVGRMLHLHSQAFGFSGTKDRRGITSQYVTLFKVDPHKLAALNPR